MIMMILFSPKKVMYFGAISVMILAPLLFIPLSSGKPASVFFCQFFLMIFLSCYGGPLSILLIEGAEGNLQYTILAIGYNAAQAIFGGSAPVVAEFLAKEGGQVLTAFYISFTAILSIISVRCIQTDTLSLSYATMTNESPKPKSNNDLIVVSERNHLEVTI